MSKHASRRDRKGRSAAHSSESDPQAAGHRHERLSRIFREELEALVRDELGDPRLDGVIFTSIELSVDYKNARIGFVGPRASDTPHEERDRQERAFARATPFLRARLAESVDLKQVPALRFVWDTLAAEGPRD